MTLTARTQAFLDLVGMVYDAATDAAKWDRALAAMAGLFESDFAQIHVLDPEDMEVSFTRVHGIAQADLDRWTARTIEDPRAAAMLRRPGQPVIDRDVVSPTRLRATAFYREVLEPSGIEHTLFYFHPDPEQPQSAMVYAVMRGPHRPPFVREDADLFGELAPHVLRAVALHRRFAQLDFAQSAAVETLEAIPVAVLLADRPAKLLFANREARGLLATGVGLSETRGELRGASPADSAALRRTLAEVLDAADRGESQPGRSLSLSRRSDAPPLQLLVSAILRRRRRIGHTVIERPVAAIFVTDPDRTESPPAAILRRLYGLTPAEAAVLEKLVGGRSLDEAAAALEVSRNTVRSHLSRLFAKTGTRRQAELVAQVLSSPAWLSRHLGGN